MNESWFFYVRHNGDIIHAEVTEWRLEANGKVCFFNMRGKDGLTEWVSSRDLYGSFGTALKYKRKIFKEEELNPGIIQRIKKFFNLSKKGESTL